MEKVKTSIRLDKEQYDELKELANFHGESVTAFMRRILLERLEDENDYISAVESIQTSNGETVSREEIMKRLGM